MEDISAQRGDRRIGRWLLFLIVGPALVLGLGLMALLRAPPSDLLLDELAQTFRRETGYTLSFSERSSLVMWPMTRIDLKDVTISRPSLVPTEHSVLASIKRVTANIDVASLLQNRRRLDAIVIDTPKVRLLAEDLRRADAAKGRGATIEFGRVALNDGALSYQDTPADDELSAARINIALDQVKPDQITQIQGKFDWRGEPVTVAGTFGSAGGGTAKLTLKVQTAALDGSFDGALTQAGDARFEGDAKISLTSFAGFARLIAPERMADVGAIAGGATLAGPVVFSRQQVHFKNVDVSSKIAEGRVDALVDWRRSQPRVEGRAAWQRLDLTTFLPDATPLMVPSSPNGSSGPPLEVSSGGQDIETYLDGLSDPASSSRGLTSRRPGAPMAPPPEKSPLSAKTFDFSFLSMIDLELVQTSAALVAGEIHLDDVASRAVLDGGKLRLEIKQAKWADGAWSGTLDIDGRAATAVHALVVRGVGADAGRIQASMIGAAALEGSTDVSAELSARGNGLLAMLHSLSGRAELELRDGRMIGFDLRSMLQCWCKRRFDRRRATPFDRVRARLRLTNGVIGTAGPATLRSRHVELDTNGTISLTRNTLDHKLRARLTPPPSELPIPLRVSGMWHAPRVAVDLGIFSLMPDRYELPFRREVPVALMAAPAPIVDGRSAGHARSLAPAGTDLPAALEVKIRKALASPRIAEQIPVKLRTVLEQLIGRGN